MSLYQRLGGSDAITAVVNKFYEIMLQDKRVLHFFASTDMNKQKIRQNQFLTLVTGGPNIYQGTDMVKAHCKHAIGTLEFDATWQNLENSLKIFNVPAKQINQVKEIFYSVQGQIVNIKNQPQNNNNQNINSSKPTEKTLYEMLGGNEALTLVVNKFYDLMLQDKRVSHYFSNTNMQKQRKSQIQFLAMVTGGPLNYAGKDMKQAHCPYQIGIFEFNATWENLYKALNNFNVNQALIKEIKNIFYSVESQIVNKKSQPVQKNIVHKQYDQSEIQKCPHMNAKLKELQISHLNLNISEEQKRKIRLQFIKKQSQGKPHQKLSNCPYQKHFY